MEFYLAQWLGLPITEATRHGAASTQSLPSLQSPWASGGEVTPTKGSTLKLKFD